MPQLAVSPTTQRRRIAAVALLTILALMYSSTFLSDYLLNDECDCIGYHFHALENARHQLFSYGRWLHGLLGAFVYNFVGLDPSRAALVRFSSFAGLAAAAVYLVRKLDASDELEAFFIVLLFFSQRAIQGTMGYSLHLITGSVPAIGLSLAAFHLHFFVFDGVGRRKWGERAIVLLIFVTALQCSQTYAFFAMAPLAYRCLRDWDACKDKVWPFFIVAVVSLAIATISLRIGLEALHRSGEAGYELAEEGVDAVVHRPLTMLLHAIDPRSYWSVFTIGTYPFPFQRLTPQESTRMTIGLVVMALWLGLLGAAIYIQRAGGFAKWWALLTCLVFGGVVLVADSPDAIIEHRPHVVTVLSGVVIFSGAYAWSVVTRRRLDWLAGIFVVVTALGAQANVATAIVNLRADQLTFIRTELESRPSYRRIVVVVPEEGGPCIAAPCSPWMGRVMQGRWHETREQRYRYALATVGIDPRSKEIVFTSEPPAAAEPGELVIDWRKFIAAEARGARHAVE